MGVIIIKIYKPDFEIHREEGMNFLFFNFPWGASGSIYWEIGPPIWWLPKLETNKDSFRMGWFLFAFGLGYRSLKRRIEICRKGD